MAEKMTFEKAMEAMNTMSTEEQKAKMKNLEKMCVCEMCPSHIGTGEKRRLFCLAGKSKVIKKENGCICMTCPVQKSMALKWSYYCTRGSGKERAEMNHAMLGGRDSYG